MDNELAKRLAYVEQHTILLAKAGSQSYGTALPTSDTDWKGICLLPDRKHFYGLTTFEQQDSGWPEKDKVVYHLPKFMKLAGDNNPNVLEALWVDEADIRTITPAGRRLREKRDIFLSKKARHTFSGYAAAQLRRINSHKRWLDNAPSEPKIEDFRHRHIIEVGPLGTEEFAEKTRIVSLVQTIGESERNDWFKLDVEKFDRTGYEAAKKEWDHYREWRKNRNEARAALERVCNYDSKHGSHLVRLMRCGYEILTEGVYRVKRPDAAELLEIRAGAWSYEKLIAYATDMDAKITEAEKKSTLPYAPNWPAIEALQIELVEECLSRKCQ